MSQILVIDSVVAGMAWSTIRAIGGDISLTHAIVRGGGDPLNTLVAYAGALRVQTGSLHVDDVEIADSKSQGVYLDGAVPFVLGLQRVFTGARFSLA